jgi:hypothetical protein
MKTLCPTTLVTTCYFLVHTGQSHDGRGPPTANKADHAPRPFITDMSAPAFRVPPVMRVHRKSRCWLLAQPIRSTRLGHCSKQRSGSLSNGREHIQALAIIPNHCAAPSSPLLAVLARTRRKIGAFGFLTPKDRSI